MVLNLTYKDNRKCEHCGSPIADQEHKAQKFCTKGIYADGSIKNCKDQFWSEQRREQKDIYQAMVAYHRSCYDTLHHLYNLNIPEITLEHLEQMGVDLSKSAVHRTIGNDHLFYYFGFYVSVNSINHKIQIHHHYDKLF